MKTAAEQHLFDQLKVRCGIVVKRRDILRLKKMIKGGKSEPYAFTASKDRLIHHVYYNKCHLYLIYQYSTGEIVTCLTRKMINEKARTEKWRFYGKS